MSSRSTTNQNLTNQNKLSPLVTFQAGDLIFATGDQADKAFIIESGRVEIFIDIDQQHICLRELGKGEVFGEMAVMDATHRSASARALENTQCLIVSSDQISERIAATDPVVKLLITTLLGRMRSVTSRSFHPSLPNAMGAESLPVSLPVSANMSAHMSANMSANVSIDLEVQPLAHEQVLDKMRLESELREALTLDALEPHYQALVDLQRGVILGFEFLVRWRSASRGQVSPDLFIKTAEETSLIIPVGRWTLERACQDLTRFQASLTAQTQPSAVGETVSLTQAPLFMSVNVSAREFQSPHFLAELLAIAHQYNINPAHLKLEVTERLLMEAEAAIDTIHKCRQAGFRIAIDDFGTGFSSLSYLTRFEVDSLKIDQSFIREMLQKERTLILVKTILAMTHDLKMTSLAEGIETPEHLEMLQQLGCQIGQGYLFSKPLPFADAEALLLRNWETRLSF